jgi:hypothetical protein
MSKDTNAIGHSSILHENSLQKVVNCKIKCMNILSCFILKYLISIRVEKLEKRKKKLISLYCA